MKHVFSILIMVLFVDFGTSQNKIETKTLKFSDYKLEYPKTWKIKKNPYGVSLFPKYTKNYKSRVASVYLTTKRLKSSALNKNVEAVLKEHAETYDYHIEKKTFALVRLKNNPNFNYKIVYKILYVSSEDYYTREEFFKINGKQIFILSYSGKGSFFEEHYNEGLLIINSIEKH